MSDSEGRTAQEMRPGVLELVDSTALGGMERVAVNIANRIPPDRFTSHLCTTRSAGPLSRTIEPHVGQLALNRKRRIEPRALTRLAEYCRTNGVSIIHAHGTALFVAVQTSLLPPFPKVIWHDHYGDHLNRPRSPLPYWLACRRVAHVFSVSLPLKSWAEQKLAVPRRKIEYLPNFVVAPCEPPRPCSDLPGTKGSRIVCVANFRRQKDHLTLIRAMNLLVQAGHSATLLLIGAEDDKDYADEVRMAIAESRLGDCVHFLGAREDVPSILCSSDIGVLSSASEGLPLALLEYGLHGLAPVTTGVGQCPEVLAPVSNETVVPPRDPEALANVLRSLLANTQRRHELARRFQAHVLATYSMDSAMSRMIAVFARLSHRRREIERSQ